MQEAYRKEIIKPAAGSREWMVTGFRLALPGGGIAIAMGWNYDATPKPPLQGVPVSLKQMTQNKNIDRIKHGIN
jgi:hypothetical protein